MARCSPTMRMPECSASTTRRDRPVSQMPGPSGQAIRMSSELVRLGQNQDLFPGGVLLLLALALDGSRHRRNTDFAVAAVELDLAALWARIAIGLVLAFHAAFSF